MVWHDLTHDFEHGMPVPDWPGEKRHEFELSSFHVTVNSGTQNVLAMNLHCGTHVDAPSHYDPNGPSIDQMPFDYLVGETAVLDVRKNGLEAVTLEDVKAHEKQLQGKKIVILRTSWEEKWMTKEYETMYPYLAPELGPYFVSLKLHAIGLDTPGPDAPIRSGHRKGDPLHISLLGSKIMLLENLANLKSVVGKDVYLRTYPLRLKGATGSPLRVLAKDDL